MNRIHALIVGASLALASLAAQAASPFVGTWVLDAAKSSFEGTPAPKSIERSYSESAAGIHMSAKYVGADGKVTTQQATYKIDGKYYALKGSPDYDHLALKAKDANTVEFTQKKDGKEVGTGMRTVSADGRTLTMTNTWTTAAGGKARTTQVYDRK